MGYDERIVRNKICRQYLVLVSWTIGTNTKQGNKSVKERVEKFDEFLIRCNTLKGKLKFFLDSELALEMTYELNC